MRKRVVVAAAVVTVVVVATMATVSSAGSGPKKFTVIERATTDAVIDTGALGDSTGDLLTFHNEVFDETDSVVVGTDQGQCIRIDPVAGTWECAWTNFLEGGQITVQGPFFDTSSSTLAITGGTGAYKNAGGTMKLVALAGGTEFEFTFRVIG